MALERVQISIQGLVQGVGFRPCVYKLAKQMELTGFVQNNASGVLIEIQGQYLSQFIPKLRDQLPPLATIHNVEFISLPVISNETAFEILDSQQGKANTAITPDVCICSECLSELFDPQSRYYRYPFLNCTHCGPRFTITRNLPYDRCQTSMSQFRLCQWCQSDYLNPDNRRYHAQPTACGHCGPQLSVSVDEITQRIGEGEIIALKGLGGYQFICDARNEETISKLRLRKNRETKPFALMVANVKSAERIAEVSSQARLVLESRERPIVLLRKKGAFLPDGIAPGLNHLGIMLPSTPLHYLLFNSFLGNPDYCQWLDEYHPMVLVVTSANIGGEPLIIDDKKAEQGLLAIADKIVSHDREIITRADDSVVHMVNEAPRLIRRARGYVPIPLKLPYEIPPTLALGGHLKNTFCITRGNEAFVSQHIGSLNNKATIEYFHESLHHLLKFLAVKPEKIACDWHPDFYTSRLAQEYGLPFYGVQHHHAHLASVAAEYGIQEPVLGLVLDGYGFGSNSESWGGELLLLEKATFKRIGHFFPILQPGGELAAREPWRMAAGILYTLGRGDEIPQRFKEQTQAPYLLQLLEKKIHCPLTTSCGRLFDAVSALLGVESLSRFEGHAAMRLESMVTHPQILNKGWVINDNVFDMRPALRFLANTKEQQLGANLFHGTLIAGLSEWITGICREKGMRMLLLSGGCFLNQVLAEGLVHSLIKSGINPLLPQLLPPNDGGIALGQAWIVGIKE
ncbi:carbamoyltransferase HypF [Legionella pneumophila]|uniref:Carbamoyltransferase HypF n=1 Tax=Legionella pneumophila subsp. pascullei TaxID=91890 RepID=A0AAX2IYP0_LEGPN|nr:carbamoyltransferase HypF [Legionella pneumophila]AMP90981.2 carbamoyltransferase HypF [Legionella pneumophila subsp. pascullei]SQG91304.1 hydrogenase maturation protein HypF [Legionella pneumophila subsp. pascullei]VEH07850.1 hydrogenase maturation protein HypF [Legionella pneumophila subsp. pascullei]HAT6917229.1 carbamoyltransferase HypF [Legionella pneumophila]HAT6919672.1 carbamoyltransferase HypF [Legionella pneumophila]